MYTFNLLDRVPRIKSGKMLTHRMTKTARLLKPTLDDGKLTLENGKPTFDKGNSILDYEKNQQWAMENSHCTMGNGLQHLF